MGKGKVNRVHSYNPRTPKSWYQKTSGRIGIAVVVIFLGFWIYSSVSLKIQRKQYQPKHVKPLKTKVAKGVTKDVIVEGTGEQAKIGDTVKVQFVMKSPDGATLEANSEEDPFTFQIGNNVFEGFSLAAASMKVGEKAKFVLSPDVVSGGITQRLKKGSQLLLELELLEILPENQN